MTVEISNLTTCRLSQIRVEKNKFNKIAFLMSRECKFTGNDKFSIRA